MKALSKRFLFSLLVSSLCLNAAHSDEIARPLSSGLVFPTAADAPSLDPAALAGENLDVVRATYEQPTGSSGQDYAADVAHAGKFLGFGATVNATNNETAESGFKLGSGTLGAAVGMGWIHVGASAEFGSLTLNGLSPSAATWNVGVIVGKEDGFRLAALATSVTDTANGTISLGVGYSRRHRFQLELDVERPYVAGTSTAYTVTGAGVVYFGKLGLGGFATEQTTATLTSTSGLTYGAETEFSLTHSLVIDAHYAPGANGYWLAGLSIAF